MATKDPKKIDLQSRSWELLRSGYSVREVAKRLSTVDKPITSQQVVKWRDEILNEIAESTRLDAEQYRAIELERLDKIGVALDVVMARITSDFGLDEGGRSLVTAGDEDPIAMMAMELKAAQILATIAEKQIKISDGRAKLLGLNSPTKIEATTTVNGGAVEVDFKSMTDEQLSLFYAEQFK